METAGTAEAADAARFPFHTPAGDDDGRVKGEIARLAALLEEDPLFDMVPRDAEPACAPNVVRFRFTGAGAYGIPPSQVTETFAAFVEGGGGVMMAMVVGLWWGGRCYVCLYVCIFSLQPDVFDLVLLGWRKTKHQRNEKHISMASRPCIYFSMVV